MIFYKHCLQKLYDVSSGEEVCDRLKVMWDEYVEESSFGVYWREKTQLREDNDVDSDEEDVFEFDLPGNRGLCKEKDKGVRKRNEIGKDSESDELSESLNATSESSESEDESVKIRRKKRICRSHDNRTNEELTDLFDDGSTSE